MKEQFTPGKWEVYGHNLRQVIVDNGSGGYDPICKCEGNFYVTKENNFQCDKANAQLIAAAPGMYEALKILAAILEPMLNNPAHESVMIKVKAALSKAVQK